MLSVYTILLSKNELDIKQLRIKQLCNIIFTFQITSSETLQFLPACSQELAQWLKKNTEETHPEPQSALYDPELCIQ